MGIESTCPHPAEHSKVEFREVVGAPAWARVCQVCSAVQLVGFDVAVQSFVDRLNANAAALTAAGRRPLYHRFGFEVLKTQARIFSIDTAGSRSAQAFVGMNGIIRRADSWKKAGRTLGTYNDLTAFEYFTGPQ